MATNSSSSSAYSRVCWGPYCEHGLPCDVLTSRTAANPGRRFFRCQVRKSDDCHFFEWVDQSNSAYCKSHCARIRRMEMENFERQLQLKDEYAIILTEKMNMKNEECEQLKGKLEDALEDLQVFKKWACVAFLTAVVCGFLFLLRIHAYMNN